MSRDQDGGSPKDSHYARLRRAHRAAKGGPPQPVRKRRAGGAQAAEAGDGLVRLYGLHTVRAALDNPARVVRRMLVTRNAARRLGIDDPAALAFPVELAEPRALDAFAGAEAVHQGVAIEAEPLRPATLDALGAARLVLVLDQVTDPHNVGAIMRSAVAFGADALVTTARHSPAESGVLAKAASGALEAIGHLEVRNLAEALERLAAAGFQTVGLDSDAPHDLEDALDGARVALVLGAEGKGLRHKTRETVATLARLALPGRIRSLNVSNAAAVALHVARRHLDRGPGPAPKG
ncbi:RNA methyltransferase [Aquibium sp. A9E412]|uniref:TrmH family RNA methyltransferase n=1 Tax=Aquibium sp. A9E412 TaxID=2976767 RepID=UPI0025B01824|nr:RNA methyltransferase [Aquibium sp. A9E412]MDN2567382.1 RNA methyltransferase [Aquibium sp. A9E412]